MPVNVPSGLPAIDILNKENIFLMTSERAEHQDIRPLKIAIVNLMPTKIATETQLLRLLSNTPLQVEASLVSMAAHTSKNATLQHMEAFYVNSPEVRASDLKFDGLIVTGAPVETLPFEQVDYWSELQALFEWSRTHVYSSLFICWGANAALWHFHNIEKRMLKDKLFGIYPQERYDASAQLLIGLDDPFYMPQSRYATILPEDGEAAGLKILAGSPQTGATIMTSMDGRQVYVTGHLEYDADTLDKEYRRDVAAGLDIAVPINYYPNDDPTKEPQVRWRSYAHQFFANWLNYYVYQQTPYMLSEIN